MSCVWQRSSYLWHWGGAALCCLGLILGTDRAQAALVPGFVYVDNVHADIAMPLIRSSVNDAGSWQPHVHTGAYASSGWTNYATNQAVLVLNASTKVSRPTSGNQASSAYDFLGVEPGEQYFRLTQGQTAGQLFLGVEADYAATPASGASSNSANHPVRMLASNSTNWASWDPDGAGPAGTSRQMEIALLGVRYNPDPWATTATNNGAAQGAFFSIWSTGSFGELQLRAASQDGITGSDELYQTIRSHSHFNWAFSRAGFYEIDLRPRTFLGSGGGSGVAGSEQLGPLTTFHFMVVPEPSTWGLAVVAVVLGASLQASNSLPRPYRQRDQDRQLAGSAGSTAAS